MQTLYSPSLDPRAEALGSRRAIASETKFLLDRPLAAEIRDWARARLAPDPHGRGAAADTYAISTIYLDTPGFDVLRRTGSYARGKYRIRRYGESESIFVERKLKVDGQVQKRRTQLPMSQLDALRDSKPDPSWTAYWYHRRMQLRRLEPVCQIVYNRTARMAATERGPIRLTLDDDILATSARTFEFQPQAAPARLFEDQIILELKYVQPLPAVFTELIVKFGLQPQAASKYRLAGAALGFGMEEHA